MLILAAALTSCSGSTDAAALRVTLGIPETVVGYWTPGDLNKMLYCQPDLVVTASGEGRAVWTGGSATATQADSDFPIVWSAAEVRQMLGSDGITAGQTMTVTFTRVAYVGFVFDFNFDYRVEGTGETGRAHAKFKCRPPPV